MSGAFHTLQKLKLRAIIPSYTTKYSSIFAWNQILDDRCHPLYGTTVRRYEQRDNSGLWWSVTTPTHGKKRVVRSWVCRRLRQAFCEALEAQGLDKDGKAMARTGDTGLNQERHTMKLPDLYGTLRIGANNNASTAKYGELRKECDMLVGALLKLCSPPKAAADSRPTVPSYKPRGNGPPRYLSASGPKPMAGALASSTPRRNAHRPYHEHVKASAI